MDIGQYFARSKGDFPKTGVKGVESAWMDYETLTVPNGRLWVGDPWQVDETQCSVDVAPGMYRVQVMGMDFKGHRRVARMRACLNSVARPVRGKACGQTGTDVAVVGLCDIGTFEEDVRRRHLRKYGKDIEAALDAGGIGCIQFDYGRKSGESFGRMALLPSGLGDGAFEVYPLRSGRRVVGLEVVFLPPGFKLEHDIPRIG